MDGAASDLRTGLPWQMIEIHEPLRLLIVVETTPDAMLGLMEKNETIRQLAVNEWVQLATLSPDSNEIQLFGSKGFAPYHPATESLPAAKSSFDWYRGRRDNLGFAKIAVEREIDNSHA